MTGCISTFVEILDQPASLPKEFECFVVSIEKRETGIRKSVHKVKGRRKKRR